MTDTAILGQRINFDVDLPEIPHSWMIGASSRFVDCWEPHLEWIRMPALRSPQQDYFVECRHNEVSMCPSLSGKSQSGFHQLKTSRTIEAIGPYVDLRILGGDNISHAIITGLINFFACHSAARTIGILPPLVAILPRNTKSYITDLYDIFGIRVLKTDAPIQGTRFTTNFNIFACLGLASRMIPKSFAQVLNQTAPRMPKRIFLARRSGRCVRNAETIESLLSAEGFTKVYFEEMPVLEQLRHVWNADIIAGVHGAAFGALLFRGLKATGHPCKVIELFGPGYVVTLYRSLVAAVGGAWLGVRGAISADVVDRLRETKPPGVLQRSLHKIKSRLSPSTTIKESVWQRTCHAMDFEVDPLAIEASLALLGGQIDSPPSRYILAPPIFPG